jgi:hypothetical protein
MPLAVGGGPPALGNGLLAPPGGDPPRLTLRPRTGPPIPALGEARAVLRTVLLRVGPLVDADLVGPSPPGDVRSAALLATLSVVFDRPRPLADSSPPVPE